MLRCDEELQGGSTVTLFRPVGPQELALIRESGYSAFPPRLPGQPIFYPVLSIDYATAIARDWNSKDPAGGYLGYVTRFCVNSEFLHLYEIHKVGSRIHQEYWIPSDDLPKFNQNIIGPIEVIAGFYRGSMQLSLLDIDPDNNIS
jgi:hypothetical protein